MHVNALKEHLKAQPFRPFWLVLATGARVEVRHPETVAIGDRTAVVIEPGDRTRAIDVALVVELVTEPTAPAGQVRAEAEG